jgi:hypothetical protein
MTDKTVRRIRSLLEMHEWSLKHQNIIGSITDILQRNTYGLYVEQDIDKKAVSDIIQSIQLRPRK